MKFTSLTFLRLTTVLLTLKLTALAQDTTTSDAIIRPTLPSAPPPTTPPSITTPTTPESGPTTGITISTPTITTTTPGPSGDTVTSTGGNATPPSTDNSTLTDTVTPTVGNATAILSSTVSAPSNDTVTLTGGNATATPGPSSTDNSSILTTTGSAINTTAPSGNPTPQGSSATLSNKNPLPSNNPTNTDDPPTTSIARTTAGQVTSTSSDFLTVPLPKPTITATATQAIAPIPTAAVAKIPDKSTVNSTAPIIQYQGIWVPANSSCDSTVSSMKCKDPLSYLSYRFKALKGGSVYLGSSRSPDAGVFVVALDDVQTEIDGFSASADSSCSFTWSQSDLAPGYHNLTISFVGPSPQSQAQSGSFELNNFQLVGQDTSPPAAQGGSMSIILGGVSSSAVFFAGLLGIFLA